MKLVLVTLFSIAVAFADAQVLNIERERIKTDTTGWSGSGGLSINLISNTQRFTEIALGAHLQYKTNRSLTLALSDYEIIKSETDDFSNKGMQHFRYNYKMTKVVTWEAFTQAQFNKVLNLKFRGLLGSGPRFKILGLESFRVYSGIAYMIEYEVPEGDDNAETSQRFSSYISLTFKVGDGFSLINTTYFQPKISTFSDHRVSNNTDLVFKITRHLSYALAFEHLTDTRPLPEVPTNIYSLKNKLLLDFGK